MKDVLGKYFTVGAAVNTDIVYGRSPEEARIVTDNFNSIVAENCMKGEVIHPEENTYFWDDADRTVKFAEDNGLEIIGHCLYGTHSHQNGCLLMRTEILFRVPY